jgi:hypothetical protein
VAQRKPLTRRDLCRHRFFQGGLFQLLKLLASDWIRRVQFEHILKTDPAILVRFDDTRQPQPDLLVIWVNFNSLAEKRVGLRMITGSRGFFARLKESQELFGRI